MQHIRQIQRNSISKEEELPGLDPSFPYIATCAELDRYRESCVPWHWHRAVELFYLESGCLEYTTPGGTWVFPAGSGGFVNTNVLHTTHPRRGAAPVLQLLHLFDPVLLAGEHGSRLETKYILPLTTSGLELLPLQPDDPAHRALLTDIQAAFSLDGSAWGYELRLRQALTEIWLGLLDLAQTGQESLRQGGADEQIKALMVYIHEHYPEDLSVEQLSAACHISRRTCFRLFQEQLHTTPSAYIRSYRLQKARQALVETGDSVTTIAHRCGLGSSSSFGQLLRRESGCTPLEYRQQWHEREKNGR